MISQSQLNSEPYREVKKEERGERSDIKFQYMRNQIWYSIDQQRNHRFFIFLIYNTFLIKQKSLVPNIYECLILNDRNANYSDLISTHCIHLSNYHVLNRMYVSILHVSNTYFLKLPVCLMKVRVKTNLRNFPHLIYVSVNHMSNTYLDWIILH